MRPGVKRMRQRRRFLEASLFTPSAFLPRHRPPTPQSPGSHCTCIFERMPASNEATNNVVCKQPSRVQALSWVVTRDCELHAAVTGTGAYSGLWDCSGRHGSWRTTFTYWMPAYQSQQTIRLDMDPPDQPFVEQLLNVVPCSRLVQPKLLLLQEPQSLASIDITRSWPASRRGRGHASSFHGRSMHR